MSRIVWDEPNERVFEAGVDRGVLYLPGGIGVPWNGLTSVKQKKRQTVEPIYFEGRKVNDLILEGDYQGTLRALTYPEEFEQFMGFQEEEPGVILTGQPQGRFGLTYRSRRGTALQYPALGDRIHLLYNLSAVDASDLTYATFRDTVEPMEFQWDISSLSESIAGRKPTAHLILDSSRMDPLLWADIEDILYGSDTTEPRLPTPSTLLAFIKKWDRITILDNGDGTWTAIDKAGDYITDHGDGTFTITEANATFLDADTYEISSTSKNEEDLWPQ